MAGLLAKINSMCDTLSPAERRVAAYVVKNADKAPLQSVHEVSRAARTSVASVSRLARRVGCGSFKEFKIELAREAASSVSAVYEAIAPEDSPADIIRKVFAGNISSLQDTLGMLDFGDVVRAAGRISGARRVLVFGIGGSGNVAAELALRLVHLDVQAEAYTDSYQILLQAERSGHGDVVVGVSHSGRSAIVVEALRVAKSNGSATIGIANYSASPLSKTSDTFFVTSFHESRVRSVALSARLAQLCIFDAMCLLVARDKKVLPKAGRLNKLIDEILRLQH